MTAEDLRKSILQQAIQGKLVPQDPNDEPASELLSKIRAEKERLIKEKKIKRDKNETIIYRGEDNSYYEKILATGEVKCIDDEIPFEIPETWQWCRFSSLYWFITDGTHSTPKYTKTGVPFVSVKDMSSGHLCFTDTKFISEEEHHFLSKRCNPQKGDLLISKVGTTGIPLIIEEEREFSIFVSLALIKFNNSLINSDYLICLLKSDFVQSQIKRDTRGVGNKNWVLTSIAKTLLVLPPYFEQIRIVEKLKFLSSKLDIFEKVYSTFINQISSLSLELKKSILQYAIQGKLVSQLDIEGTAAELLEKIQHNKLQLVKEGKLKKKDLVSSAIFRGDDNKYWEKKDNELTCIDDEIPFDIPDSWQWVRLGNFVTVIGGYAFKSSDLRSPNGYRVIRISDISESGLINKNIVRYGGGLELNQYKLRQYDILLAMTGGTVGKSLLLDMPLKEVLYLNQRVAAIRCEWLYYGYIDLFLKSSYIKSIIDKRKNSTNDNISMNDINNFLMPLPPLNEQHRICNRYKEIASIMRK